MIKEFDVFDVLACVADNKRFNKISKVELNKGIAYIYNGMELIDTIYYRKIILFLNNGDVQVYEKKELVISEMSLHKYDITEVKRVIINDVSITCDNVIINYGVAYFYSDTLITGTIIKYDIKNFIIEDAYKKYKVVFINDYDIRLEEIK